jgi:glucose/arabinose dehydrogenase
MAAFDAVSTSKEFALMNSQKINGGLSSLIPAAAFIATFAAAIPAHAQTAACPSDNAGITLSPGFCATVFADKLGHSRHLAVAPNGVVYVNTWSGRYYRNDTPPPGGFLIALQSTKGDGQADNVVRFGPTKADGNAGGTGIAVYKNYVYAETNDRIVRYALPTSGIAPTAAAETVISGLPLTGDHPMHPFEIDRHGNLYVDLGSATNSCQSQNRMPNVPGNKPCTELETRGGTWRYDANKLGPVLI